MDSPDRIRFDGVPTSDEVLERIKADGGRCILAFSCGKDAVASWVALRDAGIKVFPYYMFLAPGLRFVEQSLLYFEDFFGSHILRVPHPSVYRMLDECVFQPPGRVDVIGRLQLPLPDYDELRDAVADHWKIPRETWSGSGVRAADSLNRRTHFKLHGSMNHGRRIAYPVWDWKKDELLARLRRAGVKLPVDYAIFGRSFDGVDLRFLLPIRRYFPDDYARLLEWYPLAELEIKRYEQAQELDRGRSH